MLLGDTWANGAHDWGPQLDRTETFEPDPEAAAEAYQAVVEIADALGERGQADRERAQAALSELGEEA